jgi:transposase
MKITIGIDPHKRSHTAVAVDDEENEIARTRVIAGPHQLAELNGFAAGLDGECRWAIEAASGVGLLLAQQFTRAGVDIIDVPATLAARVRGGPRRPTATMLTRSRSRRSATRDSGRCRSRTTPPRCGCWLIGTCS